MYLQCRASYELELYTVIVLVKIVRNIATMEIELFDFKCDGNI